MNRIEVTIDGQDIVISGWCRLDINEAEGLRDILDDCIRRINDDAREYSERERAAQRSRDIERVLRERLAGKP